MSGGLRSRLGQIKREITMTIQETLTAAFLLAFKAAITRYAQGEKGKNRLFTGWQGTKPAIQYRKPKNKTPVVVVKLGDQEYELHPLAWFHERAVRDLFNDVKSTVAVVQLCQKLQYDIIVKRDSRIPIANMAIEEFPAIFETMK